MRGSGRGDWAAILAAALVGAVARLRPFESADLLWQIKTGREVLVRHARVTTDLWSWSFRGQPVHDHEAGFEAVVAWGYAHFGFGGLWWANVALVVAVAVIATHMAREFVGDAPSRVVGVSCVLAVAWPRLELRPEHATYLATAAAYLTIRTGKRRFLPVPIAAVAALFHGLAPLVAMAPLAVAIGTFVEERRVAKLELASAAGCVVACELVAPGTVRNLFANAGGVSHIVEWYSPLHYARVTGRVLPFFMIGVAAASLAGLVKLVRAGAAKAGDVVFVTIFALLGLRWVRIAAIAPVVSMPLAIAGIASLADWGFSRARRWIGPLGATAAVLAALFVASDEAEMGFIRGGAWMRGFDFDGQPVRAVDWMRKHRPNAALFHGYNAGAYLIWADFPPRGVVIDGRAATLYPNEFTARYYDALGDPAQFETWAASAPFDTVLLQRRHKGSRVLMEYLQNNSSRWALAYRDEGYSVFVRTN